MFDLSETPEQPQQIDLGPSSSPAYSDPEYAKDKAEKFAFGINADPKYVQAQLASGGEYALRDSAARQKALEQKSLRNKMMYEAAGKLNRPLTSSDLNDFDALSKANPKVDPATVLEESYGAAFSNFLIGSAKDTTVPREAMNLLPEASLDAMDSIGQAVAKREIANQYLKELTQSHEEMANEVTVGNLFKGTAQVIAGGLFPSMTKSARETLKGFSLVGDYAKMFIPAYVNVKLGGLKVDLGKSLEEQYQQFALMSPSEFKTEFKATLDHLRESNLPLAMQYAAGYQHYSVSDKNLNSLFGYADWLSLGGTVWAARNAIKGFRAVPKGAPGEAGGFRGGPVPEGPSPYDVLGVAPNSSADEIKAAFRKAAKESHPDVNPQGEDRFKDVSNAWEILGDKEKRSKYDAGQLHEEWSQAKAGSSPKGSTTAEPVPEPTPNDQIQYIKDFRTAAKDTVRAANEERPEDALSRLGEIDGAAAELAHKKIVDQFKGLDPFDDSLQLRDKLVSLFYPHEIGDNPGSLTREQADRLTAHGKANATTLLGILTNNAAPVRLTDEQVKVALELNKQEMLDQYKHANDAILDVDTGGPFVLYTPEQQGVNVHTLELRMGQIPTKTQETPSATTVKPDSAQLRGELNSYFNSGDAIEEPRLSPFAKQVLGRMSKADKDQLHGARGRHVGMYGDERTGELGANDLLDKDQLEDVRKGHEASLVKDGAANKRLIEAIEEVLGTRPQAPKTPPKTGDDFLDSLNRHTSTKGRTLARDLYDKMKTEGSFTGNLVEFRQKVNTLRKEKKIAMSAHTDTLPAQSPEIKKSVSKNQSEEGNFASEFRRDIGYGNETHRNRIIDSELTVKPRSKYTSPVRAHYVEPPKGFEPKKDTTKPKQTVNYPKANPTTDEELMNALTDLMTKVAQTDNHDLWTRLSKSLNKVEARNFNEKRNQNLGLDTREFDTDLLGSPYAKHTAQPPHKRRLSEDEQAKYANLEGTAYDYLNSLAKNKKVGYQIKMGTPKATLFKKRDQAAYYATNVYGLSTNQYRVMQQGNGYYISIPKILEETHDATRDMGITTSNKSNDRLANALFGTMVTPDEYVGELSRLNRKVASYGPQEMHRLVQSSAENLLDLTHDEREDLRSIFIANRDFKYLDENNDVRRGRFNTTYGALEREFMDRFNRLPSERQTAAYFDYVRLYDLDLAMRELALVRDVGRLGLEKTTVGYHRSDPEGAVQRKQSKAFSSRVTDKLPVDDATGENWGVWIYNPHSKSGEFHLRSDLNQKILDDVDDKVNNHGFKILEIGNPLEKPLRHIAKTDENVNFIVVKDFDKRKYTWSNIPRRAGGHVDYQDGFFGKQPIIRRTEQSGRLRHIYEGDETILNFTTEAQAKKVMPQIDIGRKLMKEGRLTELERHLAKNTPFEMDQFQAFFKPRVDKEGNEIPSRFSLDDEFTYTLSGKNTFDMAHYKGKAANYVNFVDAIRSKYNLFANNVDKKYLGSRDPDVPAVFEFQLEGKEPAMVLTPPRLIDPYEVINSSLANVIRSKYLNDVKMQAAENFIQEFASVMKTPLSDMRRNPVWYLHNPDWDTHTDDNMLRLTGKHVRQAALNMIGTESEIGKALTWSNRKLTNSIYERMGQTKADKYTDSVRNAKNPLDFMRAVVFHTKLGLFNPIQTIKQGVQIANATAIEGLPAATRAFPKAILARWLALTEDPKIIDGMIAGMSKDFDGEAFKEAYLELKKTGLYNVGGEYANRDDFFDPKVFQSKVGAFFDKGTMFFKEGERFPRLLSWFMAYDKWRLANPDKVMSNLDRAKVLDRADLLTNNMSRASNANIQSGSFATTTQFFSYKWRLAEQLLGTRLTRSEKLSLLVTNMALWGVPIGASALTIWDYYDDIRKDSLEAGYPMDNPAIQALHEGIISMAIAQITGQEYNVGKDFGPAGLNIVKELFTGDKTLLDFVGGASGSVLQDMLKTSHGAFDFVMNFMDPKHDAPTNQDLIDFTRNISTVNNAIRAYYMFNAGKYITSNEHEVVDGLGTGDAIANFFFGLTPTKVGDTFLMIKSNKEKKKAEQGAINEAVKYITRSLRADADHDEYLSLANLRKAKAALIAGGVPSQDWGKALKQAYKGQEPLFDQVLRDFVKQSPDKERKAREAEAERKMKGKYQ